MWVRKIWSVVGSWGMWVEGCGWMEGGGWEVDGGWWRWRVRTEGESDGTRE